LRADDEAVRAQPATLYESLKTAFAFTNDCVFRADALFIRTQLAIW
jgi:hypothetical protein